MEDDELWPEIDRRQSGFLARAGVLAEDHQRLDAVFSDVDEALTALARASDGSSLVDATPMTQPRPPRRCTTW